MAVQNPAGDRLRLSPGAKGRGKGAKKPSRWPRPASALPVKTFVRFLTVLDRWAQGEEEPVVGRIREEGGDPFSILVATILSLRTRDAVTEKAAARLAPLASTPAALRDLPLEVLEEAIRPVGFYRTKARTLKALAGALLERHGGEVPADLETLLALPGVGRKTANLVLTEGFRKPGICVDTHVHRICNWWGVVETRSPEETELELRKILPRRWWIPVNGLLVSFGQKVCRPVAPRCAACPLARDCPYPGKRSGGG